ncbi:MAG: DUF2169 domain-containing protein [Sandaracinaceae bacterium]
MRGIKPFKLGMIARPFQWGRQHHLGISVLAYFAFEPVGALFSDAEMWPELAALLGQDLVLDVGIPKSRAEFLLFGSAYTPGGAPALTCPVRARVGAIDRTLYAIGDRRWVRGVPSDPAPFTRMSLGWENAFGGEGFPMNPRGKGVAPVDDVHPLPNVEAPGRLVDSIAARPEPASFMPLDFTWPQRARLAGTYDQKWLDTRFPGFAEDMDWRIFNAAAVEQQQEAPFVGNEPILLENLHPKKARLTAQLPGLRGRSFITRKATPSQLEEVELRLMTVWLFPEIERGLVVFTGATPIVEDDGADVELLMIAAERLGEPRSFAHYENVLAKRLDKDKLEEHLNDADLVPKELAGLTAETSHQMELVSHEGLRMKRARAKADAEIEASRQKVADLGLDPDEHAAPRLPPDEPLPTATEVPEFVAKKRAEAEKMKAEAEAKFEEEKAKAKKLYEDLGLDWEEVEQEMKSPHRGPPTYTAEKERAQFRKMADEHAAAGTPVDELEWYATDETLYAQWKDFEARLWASYRAFAHFQDPVDRLDAEASADRIRAVREAAGTRATFSGIDFTGADFSGLDLSGLDFSGSFCEAASFVGTNLAGANFSSAVLAHADLSGARIRGASFRGANLGKAKLTRADSEGSVDLTDAILWEADLSGARLSGARLTGATLLRANLADADLAGAEGEKLVFHETRLAGLSLVGAKLTTCAFIHLDAHQADFSGATLDESGFVGCRLDECKFVNASLVNLRIVLESRAFNLDLKGANLSKANLRGLDMRGSDLSGARLDGADLSDANLEGSRLYRIVARDSSWVRTNLKDAFLVSADLMRAMLSKADIRGADFRGANLYAADFALVHGDAGTNVTDAIQLKVRTKPTREQG